MATYYRAFITLILILPSVLLLPVAQDFNSTESSFTISSENSTIASVNVTIKKKALEELNAGILSDIITTQSVVTTKKLQTTSLSSTNVQTTKRPTTSVRSTTLLTTKRKTTFLKEETSESIVNTDPPYIVHTDEPIGETEQSSTVIIVVACVLGVIFLIIIAIVVACYIRYKKRKSEGSSLFMKDEKLHYFVRDKDDQIYRNSGDRSSYRAKKGEVEILETSKMDPVGVRRSETTRSDSLYRKKKRAPAPPGPLPFTSRKSVRSTLASVSSNEADTELTTFKTNANEEVDKPLLTQQVRNGDNHEYCELDDYDRTKNPFLTEELDDNRNVK